MSNDDIREFLCQMEQFLLYIDDAMNSPDLADFDVLNSKLYMIRQMIHDMEPVIGIHRKDVNESRKNNPQGKTFSCTEKPRSNGTKADRGKQRTHGKSR